MERNYSFDMMRVVMLLFVVLVHVSKWVTYPNEWVHNAVTVFVLQCNGLFFMASGYYNLDHKFSVPEDYIRFYRKKAVTVLLPFFVTSLLLYVWGLHRDTVLFTTGLKAFLAGFYRSFMDTNADTHLWFMYALIGFLFSTPFLSKMLHAMSVSELRILWYAALIWNIVRVYLCADFGTGFRFNGWILNDWMIAYFCGYYYKKVAAAETEKKWLLLSGTAFLLTVVLKTCFPDSFRYANDLSVLYTLFIMGCFRLWDKRIVIRSARLKKMAGLLSRYVFCAYMVHMHILYSMHTRFVKTDSLGSNCLLFVFTVLLSFAAAWVILTALKPVQNLLLSRHRN